MSDAFWMQSSPRCGARCRNVGRRGDRKGKRCLAAAMPNGRCRMHGGNAAFGRRHGMFRTGRYTKKALEERAQAKQLVLEAKRDAREGFPSLAKQKIEEAYALETAWMDRYERLGPKPGRRAPHGKRPEFPNGYSNIKNPWNSGLFTKEAKAARAQTMRIRREFPNGYAGTGGRGRFTRAARVASGRETAADRVVMARREELMQLAMARMAKIEARTERRLAMAAKHPLPTRVLPKPVSEKPK
jgi:hypothetical protein